MMTNLLLVSIAPYSTLSLVLLTTQALCGVWLQQRCACRAAAALNAPRECQKFIKFHSYANFAAAASFGAGVTVPSQVHPSYVAALAFSLLFLICLLQAVQTWGTTER